MGLAKIAKLTSIVLEGMDNFHDFDVGDFGVHRLVNQDTNICVA